MPGDSGTLIIVETPCVGVVAGHILGVLRLILASIPPLGFRSGLSRLKWDRCPAAQNAVNAVPACEKQLRTS